MTKRQNPCSHLSNDADLIQDPDDCMCSPEWDKRTTENQKQCLKLFRELRQRINVVWMIKINLKGGPIHEGGRTTWPHIMYPIEFQSFKDAHDWLVLSPDPDLRPEGVKSWSYEAIRKPLPKIYEPKVRKEELKEEPKRGRRRRR